MEKTEIVKSLSQVDMKHLPMSGEFARRPVSMTRITPNPATNLATSKNYDK